MLFCFCFQVSLELATGHKDFSFQKCKNKLDPRDKLPLQTAPGTQRDTNSRSPHVDADESRLDIWYPQRQPKEPFSHLDLRTQQQQEEEEPEILLHTLLMVPDGRNFSSGATKAPNVYLNCKLFWCNEIARSVVSWGRPDPAFNFVQVSQGD